MTGRIFVGLRLLSPSGKAMTAQWRMSNTSWVCAYDDGSEVELSTAFIRQHCEAISEAPEFVVQPADANPYSLTDGQARVLDAVVEFGGSKDAAHALGLSHKTVEVHLAAIRAKMGASTITAAVLWDRYRRNEAA